MNHHMTRSGRLAITALIVTAAFAGCGSDSDEGTIPVSDWVAEFDRRCVEIGAELSDPDLTDEQFLAISERGVAEMRAIGTPDEMDAEAETLLTVLETTTADTTLDDETISNLDQQFLNAATVLGISDACIGGAQGE
jgi:hypothetical protein